MRESRLPLQNLQTMAARPVSASFPFAQGQDKDDPPAQAMGGRGEGGRGGRPALPQSPPTMAGFKQAAGKFVAASGAKPQTYAL